MASFNFNWVDDEGVKHDSKEKGEKVIKIRKMNDDNEFHWNMVDVDKYLEEGKSSKRSSRNKKAKKSVIIIEEY
ncbi:MAG: hypothetical protein IPK10_03410 [Bacteroidetes bacterium]|nr:hypothetical protein [Bacteroidota bacterium]